MKMQWRNEQAGKRLAELVEADRDITAAEMCELLALDGHNVTVEGSVVTVHQPHGADAGVTIAATKGEGK